MAYNVIPTLAGLAALAAALADEADLVIAQMVVGDGNGAVVTPVETQTTLVNLRATVPIIGVTRSGNTASFSAELGVDVGPFWIREAGLLDATGTLLFVGSVPASEKLTPVQNAYDEWTLILDAIVSGAAQISLQPPPGSLISIADMLRAPWLSVEGMTLTAPPAEPLPGAVYRVPPGATGAWSGHTHELTQWNGTIWVFKAVPVTHVVGDASTGRFWERTATGWAERWIPRNKVSRAHLLLSGCM